MVTATEPRSLPCAASTEAAPSVGPTHGLHTAPSSSPTANWPPRPAVEKPPKRCSVQLLTGPAAVRQPRLKLRHQKHGPDANQEDGRHIAEHAGIEPDRKADGGNDQTRRRRRTAPGRRRARTDPHGARSMPSPSTIGNSGNTQGDSVERIAREERQRRCGHGGLPVRLQRLCDQRLDRRAVGVAGRAGDLLAALVNDQRALFVHTEFAR